MAVWISMRMWAGYVYALFQMPTAFGTRTETETEHETQTAQLVIPI